MNEFVRNVYAGETLLNLDTRGVFSNPNYQQALKIYTEADNFDTPQLLAALSLALGDRITQMLILTDRTSTVDIAAHVLEDHVSYTDGDLKDLQVNLLVNVIKEIAGNTVVGSNQIRRQAEEILRRCALDVETHHAIKSVLFDQGVVDSMMIYCTRLPNTSSPSLVGCAA